MLLRTMVERVRTQGWFVHPEIHLQRAMLLNALGLKGEVHGGDMQ